MFIAPMVLFNQTRSGTKEIVFTIIMRVISGGQSGVDIGALQGVKLYNIKYRESGISTFGYASEGWLTEKGRREKSLRGYGLWEDHHTPGFNLSKSRNLRNVDEADLVIGMLSDQSKIYRESVKTCWYALHGEYKYSRFKKTEQGIETYSGGKPVIMAWNLSDENIQKYALYISRVITSTSARSIMFTGICESVRPGIQKLTSQLVYMLLCNLYGKSSV